MLILMIIIFLILSGTWTLEIGGFALGVSLLIFLLCHKCAGYTLHKEMSVWKKMPGILLYLLVLVKEIILSNLYVLGRVLVAADKVEPVLVTVTMPVKSDIAKAALANSITLTPGTISVEIEGGDFMIHCLNKPLSKGLDDSSFVKMLQKLEEY